MTTIEIDVAIEVDQEGRAQPYLAVRIPISLFEIRNNHVDLLRYIRGLDELRGLDDLNLVTCGKRDKDIFISSYIRVLILCSR